MGKAYAIADEDCPPDRADGGEWWVLRLGMAVVAKSRCEHGLPEKAKKDGIVLSSFAMVATDRKAAKAEVATL